METMLAVAFGRLLPVVKGSFGSITTSRYYGVAGQVGCKRRSARMQMLG